jgi:hypothetical protein
MEVSGQLHTPAALALQKEPTGIHCITDWVGPRASLTTMKKINIYFLSLESNPESSVVHLVLLSLYRRSYPGSMYVIFFIVPL